MTNVSSFNSRLPFTSDVAVSVETATAPAVKPAAAHTDSYTVRSRRSTALPDSAETRATADAQLPAPFARALATRSYETSMVPYVQIPPESTLGRWRTELDNAFNSHGFLTWAKKRGLDTKDLKLAPARGELTGIVNGKTQTFSLWDDSGWSDVSRTLLSIARGIAPEHGRAFNYPWPDGKVPLYTAGRFYNQPIDLTPKDAALYRKKLLEKTTFEFPPLPYASQRSVEALTVLQKSLGDDANRHALISALKSQSDDANGAIHLDKVKFPIDPRSALFNSQQRHEMSVAQVLELEGDRAPVNSKQAHGFALSLSFDLAHRAPRAESGGVAPNIGLLGATLLRKMRTAVSGWKKLHGTEVLNSPAGAGAGSLLHLLIGMLPEATRKKIAENPSSAMDELIRSSKALNLGKDLQNKLQVALTSTSAIESVSAALIQELDPGLGKSPFNVAGYDLYKKENAGASPTEIIKRFETHLERKVGAEAAPFAAQLLLSVAAPEFLVKDMPPNIVYGSHTWTNFCIEVSRIEQQVPGASANMTFSQVMAYGEAPLTSVQSESQLSVASGNPIIAWGLANEVIESKPGPVYGETDVKRSQDALNKQQKELSWARTALLTPAATREELALAELKRVFPDVDPTKKVLRTPWVNHEPVSLLDVYMTEPIDPDRWESLNDKDLPWKALKPRLSELVPDINKVFSEKFQEYEKIHNSAWAVQFKYQLSLLPVAEREHIKKSSISFMVVSRPFMETKMRGGRPLPIRRPRKPTEQELEALKGKHGLLIKAQGSNGKVSYYSYFPGLGKIVKERKFPGEQYNDKDDDYFGGDTKGRIARTYNIYAQYGETNNDRDAPESADKERGVYFSSRSGALGVTAASFFTRDYEVLKAEAAGITEIEKGRALDNNLKSFFLSLIPFYDGIQDAINGNVGGALFNIGFDILGFIIPGLSAARKAVKAGKPLVNIIKSSVFAGIGVSVGYTDAADIAKNLNRGTRAAYKDIKYLIDHGDEVLSRLKGSYRKYEVSRVYKEGDIVKGFYRAEDSNLIYSTVAVLKKGAWYAYSNLTNTPFGPQLAQFGVASALVNARSESSAGKTGGAALDVYRNSGVT